MMIATWNVNSVRVRLDHILDWLNKAKPDILGLQETKVEDKDFPLKVLEVAGYHVIYAGQKSYNGVALLSREKPKEILIDLPGMQDPQRRVLGATYGDLRVLNLYVPNGECLDSEKFIYKLNWLEELRLYVKEQLKYYSKLIVMGDFNIAPEDQDVYDSEIWRDRILVSKPERDALHKLLQEGFVDVFRQFEQESNTFSWWDYRGGAFWKNQGLRLDLILANTLFAKQCVSCVVDKLPRKLKQPSDHAPVVAVFED